MASSSLLMLLLLLQDSSCTVSDNMIIVRIGKGVRLRTDLTQAEREHLHDLQWQLPNGQMKNHETGSGGDRRRLLADGSLSFSCTETEDSGKYLMRAFDKDGKLIRKKEIVLQVTSGSSSSSSSSSGISGGISGSGIAAVTLAICCFLLLAFILFYFISKRRRAARIRRAAAQENVYVEMMPSPEKEEENYCALFTAPTESPLPQQDAPDVEDIYV